MVAQRSLQALERVRAAHPVSASGYVHATTAVLASGTKLLAALLGKRGDERAVAIDGLSSYQVRVLICAAAGRLSEAGVCVAVADVAARHPEFVEARVAFEVFVLAGGPQSLRAAARAWISDQVGNALPWKDLLRASDPLATMRENYLQSHDPWKSCAWQRALDAERFPRISTALQKSLLEPPVLRVVARKEASADLKEWSGQCFVVTERDKWLATFLDVTSDSRWERTHAILEEIYSRFGQPSGHPFWEDVSLRAWEAFQRWLVDHELSRLLVDGPRLEFWKRFMGEHMHVPYPTVDAAAVMIPFRRVAAVQFVDTGRATYFLPIGRVQGLRRLALDDLYKRVLALSHSGVALGRYEHRGNYWQSGAEREVRSVLTRHDS